jgi:transcriptional regulator with XRE-family HTH domain
LQTRACLKIVKKSKGEYFMSSLEIAIGEKIKSYRKKREITQEQLADYLNISFQSVSKWECGESYPDITMLPKIAMFFGVATDELLCIDKLKEQEKIKEYTNRYYDALAVGHVKEAISAMREANAKYPGNYRVMCKLAYAMNMDAYLPINDAEYRQSAHSEIISIGEKILAECKDNETRTSIIEVMCHVYSITNEKEKAKKLIEENLSRFWVSQERMLENVLEGEELTKHRQGFLLQMTEIYCSTMWELSKDFAPEDKLGVLGNITKICSMVFTDGKYGYYHVKVPHFHILAADICMDLGDSAEALENLKSAAGHYIAFDSDYVDHFKLYTAPLIDKAFYGGLVTSQKGNQAHIFLKSLAEEKYAPLRETPEFAEICETLKKHAKEDG